MISVTLSIPGVQTRLAKILTEKLNKKYHTNIVVKKVDLSFLGSVQLRGIEIRDHHKDTLLFANKLSTSLQDVKKVMQGNINLSSVSLDSVYFYMKTYKNETLDNLSVFVDKFSSNEPVDSLATPFELHTKNIYLSKLNYKIVDENSSEKPLYGISNAGGSLSDFSISGPNVSAKIRGLYGTDFKQIAIANLTTDFTYTTSKMVFKNTLLKTDVSNVNANIEFNYKREDLKDFNDKVYINALFKNSKISLKDLHKLYGEFGGDDVFYFSGNIAGTLNNFKANEIDLFSEQGLKVKANIHLKNSLNKEKPFYFYGDLKQVTSNYKQLKEILPSLLGDKLPSEFVRLGEFTLQGKTTIDSDKIDTNLSIVSAIGNASANLKLTNIDNIDNASYKGRIALADFDIGAFFNNPLFGKVTLGSDVNGTGFKIENINTGAIGVVKKVTFNEYVYHNISINGLFQNKLFNGNLLVDDPFFKIQFSGLADFSSAVHKFDFTADVKDANLVKTNLFTRDSIANLKGNISLDVAGNTLDDITGKAVFTNVVYTNQKQAYNFKRFVASSSVKNNIKTININSDDIVRGYLKGNFTFNQLLPMAQNALGSMYSNYKPYSINPSLFVEFDFSIYNQIVDVFLPEVFIGSNTNIRGRIDAANNNLKLTFISPKVIAYKNDIDSLSLRIDNKNPLFNTHLTAAKIKTKYYNVAKLNLLNRAKNDTLFFKSEFKSFDTNNETFNMDFYYTFNKDRKSVLGIQSSTFNFKDNIWQINQSKNRENKIVFNAKKKEFEFNTFQLQSKNQEITFNGAVRDSTYKNLKINFKDVKLSSFLPPVDSLEMNGVLSGNLDFLQKEGVYSPQGKLTVHNFKINSFEQGDLDLNVIGNNSYEKYQVDLGLTNDNRKSIFAKGTIDFTNVRPTLDLKVDLDKLKLNAFSPLGKDILTRIRGEASGSFTVKGFLRNPEMKGELTLKNAGLKFPYLNVDYDFEGLSKIKLENQSFIFDQLTLLDVKHKTTGQLNGSIRHENFKNWYLDLNINTDNLLVLNTQETEESLYYGTAFIKGSANIYGQTSNLTINVNAKTNPNTTFVIPLSDLKTVDNYKLIHFNEIKKNAIKKGFVPNAIKGLSLNFNLEVTKDATAEVVIDKTNGSTLRGNGAGNLQIKIDRQGAFTMDGDYTVDKGSYDFKYGGLVNRTFEVEKGGTISWNGNPANADLNITALYKTKANPAQLLENVSTNRKIPVNLITRISGNLFNSKQDFEIEIPNVNAAIKSELDFKLNDNDINEKTKQFLSLLVTGSFYNPDNASFNSSSAIIGTTSNALTGVLSDLISSNDGKVQVGVGYDVANKSNVKNLNTDDLVNVSVGTQISDRVIINGKVGVPVGSKTQSSVVGEVRVEVLLNDQGNFRGIIFNRQNEIQYSTEEEGYTQGVGLTYQVNFNTLKELLRKVGLRKKKSAKKEIATDSIKKPVANKLIRFNQSKEKNER